MHLFVNFYASLCRCCWWKYIKVKTENALAIGGCCNQFKAWNQFMATFLISFVTNGWVMPFFPFFIFIFRRIGIFPIK